MKHLVLATATAAAMLLSSAAQAGPFILAGTDADDHGSFNSGTNVNVDGWLFMQRALENLAPAVTNGNMNVTILGSTSTALAAATSAFNLSGLAATWTLTTVSTANFGTFFGPTGTLGSSGILMMDSGSSNVGGGVAGTNYSAYATVIDNFLGAGGGLFSQANGYEWLSALVPALTVVDEFATGLALTATGLAAFPGLTNGDLSSGPYHNSFGNTGGIPILATSTSTSNAVIIGGSTGSITNPGGNKVPEPGTLALFAVALGAIGIARRKKSS